VDVTGSPFAPAFYIMTGGALSAIAILSMKEYRNTPLEGRANRAAGRAHHQALARQLVRPGKR
jgi:hypothetical protein